MAQTCSSCGAELPPEIGQHAVVPDAGVVTCPTCGATVTLEKAEPTGAPGEAEEEWGVEREESFAGHETVEGVMDELEEKEGGPER